MISNIISQNIKWSNIFHFCSVTRRKTTINKIIKLSDLCVTADFGLSKIVADQVTMKTVCGTPGYCGMFFIMYSIFLVVMPIKVLLLLYSILGVCLFVFSYNASIVTPFKPIVFNGIRKV